MKGQYDDLSLSSVSVLKEKQQSLRLNRYIINIIERKNTQPPTRHHSSEAGEHEVRKIESKPVHIKDHSDQHT